MSNVTIKARLAVLQAQISGVKHAFADAPNSITNGDAPLFVNLSDRVEYHKDFYGPQIMQAIRNYQMILYAAPRGTGLSGEAVRIAEPFMDSVMEYFVARPQLGLLDNVQDSEISEGTGVKALQFGNDPWVGIAFSLRVWEAVPYEYADHE